MKKILIKIKGTVNGVGFRAFIKTAADKLNVLGYVKNDDNGGVEVGAIGETSQVNQLVGLCRIGPGLAKVESLEITELISTENYDSFEIKG